MALLDVIVPLIVGPYINEILRYLTQAVFQCYCYLQISYCFLYWCNSSYSFDNRTMRGWGNGTWFYLLATAIKIYIMPVMFSWLWAWYRHLYQCFLSLVNNSFKCQQVLRGWGHCSWFVSKWNLYWGMKGVYSFIQSSSLYTSLISRRR